MRKGIVWAVSVVVALVLFACGNKGGDTVINNATTYSISGTTTSSGAALQGVTVALSGAVSTTTTTDASGNYSFTGLANGSYTVTPGKTGYTFSPTSSAQTVNGANVSGVNFTATSTSSSPTYWTMYYTPTGGSELGPEYFQITQSGSNYSGGWRCGVFETITVTMSGSNVTLAWTDLISNMTLTGTTTADTMSGSFGGGTWRATKVSDSTCTYPWSVKDGVYQVWGTTTFVWPSYAYNLSALNQADWTLIGEGTSTKSFTVNTAYTSILVAWSGSTKFYIDAVKDMGSGSILGYGRTVRLANYLTNTSNTEPINLNAQDGVYTQTFGKGFAMIGTDMGIPVVTLSAGTGTVTVYATTTAP